MTIDNVIKTLHTLRYLRARQIVYQIYYRCFRPSPKSLIGWCPIVRDWKQEWWSPLLSVLPISDSGEIVLLGETVCLNGSIRWNDTERAKLWLYNLHYFDVLKSVGADRHVHLLSLLFENWISENPPCHGIGWEPYPLSLRIVNWVKWFSKQKNTVKQEWLFSLGMQTEALLKQIEYHILANHLFANGKALVFSGAYFKGNRAGFYLKKGLKILDREIDEQFLEDGGHFERSPMYHANLLWDLCDLVNLAQRSNLPDLQERRSKWSLLINKALYWLGLMSHPDGEISFFNDAAFDIAPNFSDVEGYAQQLISVTPELSQVNCSAGISFNWLQNTGYCIVNAGRSCKAILDAAKIGPDYQPGHAHADTLSFELSLYGQRVLVNSGTSTYALGKQRQYERSTKAHNQSGVPMMVI